ncbi:MAG: sulfatase-like hydrolase/transferase [Planctomycetes bacterium]|nr:sulfatase-like hydrolase/transferase [Planctomycetota bacterium]
MLHERLDAERANTMHFLLTVLLLSALVPQHPLGQRRARAPVLNTRPNVVVVVADDFGVDLARAYGEGAAPPCMPNLDALAAGGLLFRNAWGSPMCSPARAALLTGRHGFRTGIGEQVSQAEPGLPLAETTLPELLAGYSSSCVGKWHLSGNLGNAHPNQSGFGHYSGALRGELTDYSQWMKVTNGQAATSTTYATTDTVNDAIARMTSMPEPWFLYVAFNAPHAPFHVPPSGLCAAPACASTWCGSVNAGSSNRDKAKAAAEVMDAELGRLLAALAVEDPSAYVFFLGDNGTAAQVSEAPFLPSHAKDTLYEGGINVPLVVRGPGVAIGQCDALVSCADLFATIAELAGVATTAEDSISFAPCFANPSARPRTTVYAETFTPNGGTLPFTTHRRAVRDARYKLIRSTGQSDELYDLLFDPFETQNLLPGLTSAEQQAYTDLQAELAALGVG